MVLQDFLLTFRLFFTIPFAGITSLHGFLLPVPLKAESSLIAGKATHANGRVRAAALEGLAQG